MDRDVASSSPDEPLPAPPRPASRLLSSSPSPLRCSSGRLCTAVFSPLHCCSSPSLSAPQFKERIDEQQAEYRQSCMRKKVHAPALAFRVGDVVRHKRYQYRGVIYDHDSSCKTREEWIQHMGVSVRPAHTSSAGASMAAKLL